MHAGGAVVRTVVGHEVRVVPDELGRLECSQHPYVERLDRGLPIRHLLPGADLRATSVVAMVT